MNVFSEKGGENRANVKPKKKRTFRQFFRKYFLEGQKLEGSIAGNAENIPEDASFEEKMLTKYRKYIAVLIPFTLCQFIWWITAIKHDYLSLYATRWEMPLTMVFGATIGGMTSEGGGAVAFPVMTFGLHISPKDARDFSMMIQSFGMTMATFTILFMRVKVEWRSIIFGTLGAIPGSIFGFEYLDSIFTPEQKKMFFVSIWFSFAAALWILNREYKRKTFDHIPSFSTCRAVVLMCSGFMGGIFTSFAGSGLDVCMFSIITLLFRVSEKTATPTSIVLMSFNTVFCSYWRIMINENVNQISYDYVKICIPIVVLMAPFGSFLGSHFHRLVQASFIYILEVAALVGFLFTRPSWELLAIGAGIIAFGFAFFEILCRIGRSLVIEEEPEKREKFILA